MDWANLELLTLDGNGFTISNFLQYHVWWDSHRECGMYRGMFNKNHGTIKNLTVEGSIGIIEFFSDYVMVGTFAGVNHGTIKNSTSSVELYVTTAWWGFNVYYTYAGGIAGYNRGTITDCTFNGSIHVLAVKPNGGAMAGLNSGTITNPTNNGHIELVEWCCCCQSRRANDHPLFQRIMQLLEQRNLLNR